MASNAQFKEQTIDSIIGFLANPASRTADAIADLQVHAA